jgi:hypothetical protein
MNVEMYRLTTVHVTIFVITLATKTRMLLMSVTLSLELGLLQLRIGRISNGMHYRMLHRFSLYIANDCKSSHNNHS